ncbi:MAG: hypothetical protein HY064_05250 [Bacteroidetes bacterium]|nr:hypothetical protein [Bacteroidota bacterium]
MKEVSCDIKTKTIISVILLTIVGICMLVAPLFFHFNSHFYLLLLGMKIAGWFFVVVGGLSILIFKKVTLHQNGIRVEYYMGRTINYSFNDIIDITANMNMTPITISGRLSGEARHQIVLTPAGGKMRIILHAASSTNFMEMYHSLLFVFRERVRVNDKGMR